MLLRAGGNGKPTIKTCKVGLTVMPAIPSGAAAQQVLIDTVMDDVYGMFDPVGHRIITPVGSKYIQVMAKIRYAAQNAVGAVTAIGAIHIWRNGLPTGDLYYHEYRVIQANPGYAISLLCFTPWMAIQNPLGIQEYWTLLTNQLTTQALSLTDDGTGEENWLTVAVI